MFDGGFFNGLLIHLTNNFVNIVPGLTLADLQAQEANFAGYVPAFISITTLITLSAPGGPAVMGFEGQFTVTDPLGTGDLWDWYVTDGGSGVLLGCQQIGLAPIQVPFNEPYIQAVVYSFAGS